MSIKFLTTLTLLVFVFLMVMGLWAMSNYYARTPERVGQDQPVRVGQEPSPLRYFFQYRIIPIGDIQEGLAVS